MSQQTTANYLEDLNPLHDAAKDQVENYQPTEVSLSQDFKTAYEEKIKEKFGEIVWYEHTVFLKTTEGKLIICPNQLFLLAKILHPLGAALQKYKSALKKLIPDTNQREIVKYSRARGTDRTQLAGKLGSDVQVILWKVLSDKILASEDITDKIAELFTQHENSGDSPQLTKNDLTLFAKWLTHCEDIGAGKTLDRDDFVQSILLTTANVVHADTGYLNKIIGVFNEHSELADLLLPVAQAPATTPVGSNVIIYGAPGTGKSYFAAEYSNLTRTVFHPDTTIHDFVGAYRPSKEGDTLTYEFVPGPFIRVLVNALKNTDQHYTLLIEELNRANASAVFGEIFQLLDRDENHCSRYAVAPDKALEAYLSKEIPGHNCLLKIPANMSIVATMNSADQGVFPMDSAFKRRWAFKFMPINFSDLAYKDVPITYAGNPIKWHIFATTINTKLTEMGVNEDRHIGQYFLTREELNSPEAATSKLFLYLWDDVVRHKRKNIFGNYNTFSELLKAHKNEENIFTFDFTLDETTDSEIV